MSRFNQCFVLFVIFASSLVNCQCPDGEDKCIADAVVERNAPPGRRLLKDMNMAPTLTNRRALLASLCPETDNSVEACVKCTNAVRANPATFANDMRCGGVGNSYGSGKGSLKMDTKLNQAAQLHSEDNARMGDLTHSGSDGSRVSDRVQRAGYSHGVVRENIAFGYGSAKEVVMGWMCSHGHAENIMSCDIAEIGIGMAKGRNGRFYHTQVFACPKGSSCSCAGSGEESNFSDSDSQDQGGDPSFSDEWYPSPSSGSSTPSGYGSGSSPSGYSSDSTDSGYGSESSPSGYSSGGTPSDYESGGSSSGSGYTKPSEHDSGYSSYPSDGYTWPSSSGGSSSPTYKVFTTDHGTTTIGSSPGHAYAKVVVAGGYN